MLVRTEVRMVVRTEVRMVVCTEVRTEVCTGVCMGVCMAVCTGVCTAGLRADRARGAIWARAIMPRAGSADLADSTSSMNLAGSTSLAG